MYFKVYIDKWDMQLFLTMGDQTLQFPHHAVLYALFFPLDAETRDHSRRNTT